MPYAVIDAGFLIPLVEMGALKGDIAGGLSDIDVEVRLNFLLKNLSVSRTVLLIPTPALTECLVKRPEKGPELIDRIRKSRHFQIADFGAAAALQCADLVAHHLPRRSERKKVISRSKIKFDLQIISIAMTKNASTIYTMDEGLAKIAHSLGIAAFGFSELPLPNPAQPSLPLHRPRQIDLEGAAGATLNSDNDPIVDPKNSAPTAHQEPTCAPSGPPHPPPPHAPD